MSRISRASLRLLRVLPILLALCALTTTTFANPNHKAPSTGLQAHGRITGLKPSLQDAKAAVARLYADYNKSEQFAASLKGTPNTGLPFKKIGQEFGALWLARREASHLSLMGEPASGDLGRKLRILMVEFQRLAKNSLQNNNNMVLKRNIMTKLSRETQKRQAILQKQSQNMASGNLDAAEKALESLGEELYEQIASLSPEERKKYMPPFDTLLGELDTALNAKRRTAYVAQAMQVSKQNLALATEKLPREVTRIRSELNASATVKIGEQTTNAAGAIEYLAGLWGEASAGLIRNYALGQAMRSGSAGDASAYKANMMVPVEKLEADAKAAIISLIDVAAQKTPPAEVRVLYGEILEKLSFIDRRMGGFGISKDCEPALGRLAAKDPALGAQIAAYERATGEALKWRQKFASGQADQRLKQYPTTATQAARKQMINQSNRPELVTLPAFRPTERTLLPNTFGEPAAWMVYESGALLKGTRISTDNTLRISPDSRTSVVPFGSGVYCYVVVGLQIDKEIDALRETLLVDDTHPPLTIAAADAMSSAKLREFEQVGGNVHELNLEATVTRFVALPSAAYTLTQLGSLPTFLDTIPALEQTCWRFDVEPHWVHHKYFTFSVTPAGE